MDLDQQADKKILVARWGQGYVVQIDVMTLTETGDYSSCLGFVIRFNALLLKKFRGVDCRAKRCFVFQRQRERRRHQVHENLRVSERGSSL